MALWGSCKVLSPFLSCVPAESLCAAELVSLLKGQQPNVVIVHNLCDTYPFFMVADKELIGLVKILTLSQATQYKQGFRV